MAPWLEVVRESYPRGPFRAAIFDFDGTLSLLRRNWQDTMIPLMVEVLRESTGTSESPGELRQVVEDFVMRLNGKQTIYQMIELSNQVRSRGGKPLDPLEYKRIYHERLWKQVATRVDSVRAGVIPAEEMMVPGSVALLQHLAVAGLELYLASGTDEAYVVDEVRTLGIADFFGQRVYGALDDYRSFSKAMVLQRIMDDTRVRGADIVAFGDGFVEIEETARIGGLAIGVASNETERDGVNSWKRQRLIGAGAHWIIADYREHAELARRLCHQP